MVDVFFKKYFWVLATLVAIAVCSSLGGRAAAHLVEQNFLLGDDAQNAAAQQRRAYAPPPMERPAHSKDSERIGQRNVFCSACAPIVEKEKDKLEPPPGDRPPVKTSLPYELVSTMWVKGDPRWSMAIIRETQEKKDVMMVNAGKTLGDTPAEVLRVDPRRVYLLNNGAV